MKVYVDRSWEEIGKELKSLIDAERLKGGVLLSDGEPGIEENLLVEGMEHQRCLWHGWKDLGYMLWAEGVSKEERDNISGELKKLSISLPFGEKAVNEEDREEVREKLKEVKASLEKMVISLKSKGYLKVAGWRKALHLCGAMAWERNPGRNNYRHSGAHYAGDSSEGKTNCASWGDVGLLAMLKFLLKRYFDKQGYERYGAILQSGSMLGSSYNIEAVKMWRY